ncbi:MAG: M24 family metallopeptidase, partial [Paraperlucidibaca sp.]
MPIGYDPNPTGPIDRLVRMASRALSHYSGGADQLATQEALIGFARAQKLANDTVEHVAKQLQVGMTEYEAAQLLADYLKAHGCERYLHRPFAWFGDHARFDYSNYDEFHPSDRKLEAGASVILDVSPFVDGYIGDVGYAIAIGAPNPELEKAKAFQLQLRAQIPALFSGSMTPAEIWLEVDRIITTSGYDTIHAKYPFCTLGHRVFRVKPKKGKQLR